MADQFLKPCDLVMKGGITSGVVYPPAVMALSAGYRFRNIGGTSAGAIAAAVTAAAEYGRQTGAHETFACLQPVVEDLARPGFVAGLLQPMPDSRPLWDVLTAAASAKGAANRAQAIVVAALHARPLAGLLGFAGLLALGVGAAVGVASLDPLPAALLVVICLLLAPAVALLVLAATGASLALPAARVLRVRGYGFCPGIRQPGCQDHALMDWLHTRIQTCANLPEDRPLTFADLEAAGVGVSLEMLTTDLSLARPVRCRRDLEDYQFRAPDLLQVLPEPVVRHMVATADGTAPRDRALQDRRLRAMPGAQLPILAAVRLSLSFPGLLCAVPLWRDGERHLLSDGGIASNFPIHFFDAWFPDRPTFGLDLAGFPNMPDAARVYLPEGVEAPLQRRWTSVESLGGFLTAIKDTAQNWRDSTQRALPGYRERICQIRLKPGEGGLNLDMASPTIQAMLDAGAEAGTLLRDRFEFAEHRWTRYLIWMRLMQLGLRDVDEKFAAFGDRLAAGMPGIESFRHAYPETWCRPAGTGTRALLEIARPWGPPPAEVTFDPPAGGPQPQPIMRVVPDA